MPSPVLRMPCPSSSEPARRHVIAVCGAVPDVELDADRLREMAAALSVACDRRHGLIAELRGQVDLRVACHTPPVSPH